MSDDAQMNPPDTGSTRTPERADYREFLEREWTDLHHSRVQEWTALGVVTGAHLGLLQLVLLVRDFSLPVSLFLIVAGAAALGILFATLGILMTLRHRRLMAIKIRWIYRAEDALGLVEGEQSPGGIVPRNPAFDEPVRWAGLMLPRFLSTSWLILSFYLLLWLLDAASIVLFVLL